MPVKRRYNIKGTNDFLVLAAIFFFLCLWAIKDAWFPSDKVLKKHPSEVVVSFESSGSVEKVFVKVGDAIGEKQLLAKLRSDRMNVEYEAAKEAYTEAKKKFAMMAVASKNATKNGASEEGLVDIHEREAVAKANMEDALAKVTKLRKSIDAAELTAPSKGVVKEVSIGTHSMVEAGEAVMKLDPKDHFYLFNKSLAVFSFLAFWVFLAIHILAR
jgi:multidrug resistance efflux pump